MKINKNRKKMATGDRAFVTVNSVLLIMCFVICLYPLIYILSASISNPDAVTSGEMWLWPVDPTLEGYKYILKYNDIWLGYANTIFYTVVGTFLNLAFTIPCAYALSRKDLKGRNVIMIMFMITMYINGGLIPGYLNMQDFGLLDTRGALLVCGLVSVYNLIIARTFMANSVPYELTEAAKIDGADDFKVFFKIILPLSKPIIVVLMLYYGITHWNSYFNALIYLRDEALYPLQMFLREILINSSLSASLAQDGALSPEELLAAMQNAKTMNLIKYCVIIVSTAPMLIIYPRLQKFFQKGVMIGSVKG